jgi:hypothetical protein
VDQSDGNQLIVRVEYFPPDYYGFPTTFHFETYLNGNLVLWNSITTVEAGGS